MAHTKVSNTFRWQAGCACCSEKEGEPVCEVLVDDFTRANAPDLGSDWNITQGSWQVQSDEAYTTTPNSIALGSTPNPTPYQTVRALVRSLADGTEARVYLKNDMWVSIKYEFAAYEFAIGQGGTTIRSEFVDFQSIEEPFTLFGCYSANNELRGHVSNNNFTKTFNFQKVTPDNGGTFAGIGSGGVSGSLRMDDFEHWVAKHAGDYDLCPDCVPYIANCGWCLEEPVQTAPALIQADIQGLLNGAQCTACNTFNASFMLDHDQVCIWQLNPAPAACPDFQPSDEGILEVRIEPEIVNPSLSRIRLVAEYRLYFLNTPQGYVGRWDYYPGIEWNPGVDPDPLFDCAAMMNGAVLQPAFIEVTDPIGPAYCDYEAGSTVTISVP